jgi:hypothetical protein
MPIRRIPDTASELLKNISFETMSRTTNSSGIYYYRDPIYDSLRIIFNTKAKSITFKRELSITGGKRHEALIYDFDNMTLTKTFKEPSFHLDSIKFMEYPFCSEEEQHFMESTIQDNYFPSYQDFVKMETLKTQFMKDVYSWISEIRQKKQERRRAQLDRFHQKGLHWTSKAKRISS